MWNKRINNSIKEQSIFHTLAQDWWNPSGKFRILHKFNAVRVPYIIDQINSAFCLNNNFAALEILDVGCGGGLISEELAKLRAQVTGIDTNLEAINTAKAHARSHQINNINYLHATLENFTVDQKFDVILLLEILEHVPNLGEFFNLVFKFIKPNGIILFSTINRNIQSLLLAKVAAEYILRWVPKGIHNYNNFIKPFELQKYFVTHNFSIHDLKGIKFDLYHNCWNISNKPLINYIGCARRADT